MANNVVDTHFPHAARRSGALRKADISPCPEWRHNRRLVFEGTTLLENPGGIRFALQSGHCDLNPDAHRHIVQRMKSFCALVGKLPLTGAFPRAFIVEFPFGLAVLAIVAGVRSLLEVGSDG